MAADRVTDQMILAAIDGFNEAAADGELFLTSLRDQARMRHALADALRAEAGSVGYGLSLIVAERHRQITAEGWTSEHDDFYQDDELARAAACYVLPEKARPYDRRRGFQPPSWWPETWRSEWWKPTPKDRVRELVKAGALIAAEIDRTQRAALAQARRTDRE